MRIFALSDLHIDHAQNRAWVEALSCQDHVDDVLILAGDLSDQLPQLRWCLTTLARRFRTVLFVPGNHDLWVLRDAPALLSTGKFAQVQAACAECGVSMSPLHRGDISVVPLLSWYDDSFGVADAALRERWMDFHACRWPTGMPGNGINAHFLGMNESALRVRNRTVISFSHFVPRVDLLPADSLTTRLLLPVMGSTALEAQIRTLGPDIHVYGHSHRNTDVVHDGIRYINRSLGYPNERKKMGAGMRCILEHSFNAPLQPSDLPT